MRIAEALISPSTPPSIGVLNTSGMQDSHAWAPAAWKVGPPAPRALLYVRLGLQLSVLGLVLTWVFAHLGGLAWGPVAISETANDTGRLFNW